MLARFGDKIESINKFKCQFGSSKHMIYNKLSSGDNSLNPDHVLAVSVVLAILSIPCITTSDE